MYRQHISFVIIISSQWARLLLLNLFHRTPLLKYLWYVVAFSYIFELLPLTRSSLNFRWHIFSCSELYSVHALQYFCTQDSFEQFFVSFFPILFWSGIVLNFRHISILAECLLKSLYLAIHTYEKSRIIDQIFVTVVIGEFNQNFMNHASFGSHRTEITDTEPNSCELTRCI
jgi:hypothetical protein